MAIPMAHRGRRIGWSHWLVSRLKKPRGSSGSRVFPIGARYARRVISSDGGRYVFDLFQESSGPGCVAHEFETACAGSGMQLDGLAVRCRKGLVQIIGQNNFKFRAVHGESYTVTLFRRNTRASSARPRLSLDFTVPSGTSRTRAISR